MKYLIMAWTVAAAALVYTFNPVIAGSPPLDQARILFMHQQYDQVISVAKKGLKTYGGNPDLLVVMADAYAALGKESKAEKTYRRALALDPGHVDGNLNLAMLLVAKRERHAAVTLIKRVLAEQPDHARAHFYLGLAYHDRSDINDAFEQYKILKKLDKALAVELYNVIFSK